MLWDEDATFDSFTLSCEDDDPVPDVPLPGKERLNSAVSTTGSNKNIDHYVIATHQLKKYRAHLLVKH